MPFVFSTFSTLRYFCWRLQWIFWSTLIYCMYYHKRLYQKKTENKIISWNYQWYWHMYTCMLCYKSLRVFVCTFDEHKFLSKPFNYYTSSKFYTLRSVILTLLKITVSLTMGRWLCTKGRRNSSWDGGKLTSPLETLHTLTHTLNLHFNR